MITIDFEFETEYGVFRDALFLPEDHNLTSDEIESLKKQRLDNWVKLITTPGVAAYEPPVVPEVLTFGSDKYKLLGNKEEFNVFPGRIRVYDFVYEKENLNESSSSTEDNTSSAE